MNYFSRALEQWRLSRKLAAGFILLMLFAVGVSLLNMQAQKELIAQIQTLNDKDLLGVSNARAAQVQYSVMGRELRQALLVGPGPARAAALKFFQPRLLHQTAMPSLMMPGRATTTSSTVS